MRQNRCRCSDGTGSHIAQLSSEEVEVALLAGDDIAEFVEKPLMVGVAKLELDEPVFNAGHEQPRKGTARDRAAAPDARGRLV